MTDEHERTGTGWPQPAAPPERPAQRTPAEPALRDGPAPLDEPATHEQATDEQATHEPATDEQATDEPATDEPATDEPATDEPAPDEPALTNEPAPAQEPAPAAEAAPQPVAESAAPPPDADAASEAPSQPKSPEPASDGAARARRKRRVSAAGAVIGLLIGLLGFAFVVQLRSNSTDQQLSADRPEDLVRILSDLDARKDRLSQEINTLQNTQQQLAAGSQSRQAALAEASRRADELGILAGTLPAQGPGLRVEFRAGAKPIQASDVLDAVEELRGAGAEAMQISGTNNVTVRIVASSSFVDGSDGNLNVDGTSMVGPFTVTVIGDPQTMQIALNIPSGVVDTVHNHGGTVTIASASMVEVSALHPVTNPRYAQPAG